MRAGLVLRRLVTVIILLLFISSSDSAFAADWILTADDTQGLIAVPADPSDGASLFDVTRMTPGDSERAVVTVKNNCTFAFSLTVEVLSLNEVPDGEPDLAEQLVIEVSRNGALLDSFSGIGKYTFEDDFGSNTETVLVFKVSLPGPSTDNHFQNKEAVLQWIFTADGSGGGGGGGGSGGGGSGNTRTSTPVPDTATLVEPFTLFDTLTPLTMFEMPKTGEEPLWYSIVPGLAMILLGVSLFRKERKRAQQH